MPFDHHGSTVAFRYTHMRTWVLDVRELYVAKVQTAEETDISCNAICIVATAQFEVSEKGVGRWDLDLLPPDCHF